jgi:putative intracellular protease/amidase
MAETQDDLDEDGLVVQKYESIVLIVLPPEGFGDQILRYARSCLYNVRVGSHSVSTVTDEFVKGRLQDEFLVDYALADAAMDDYSGILIAGGEGTPTLSENGKVLDLVRAADRDGKLIAGWGDAALTFARAGVVKGRKVTGDSRYADAVTQAGGKFTGRQVEANKNFITASDEGAGMRFGQALAEVVRI